MLDHGECAKAVIFEFKEPIVVIEWQVPLQSEGARLARSTLRMVWESILALRPNVRFCSGSKSAKRQRRWHSGRELQRFAFTKAVLRIDLPRSATPLLWSIFSTVATTAGFLRT